jgi:hypothetical protein
MRLSKIFSLLALSILIIPACQLLEPENDNHSTFDRVYAEPTYAEGLLIRAYTFLPTNDYRWDEVATDDAVTNDKFNTYMRMATGEWSALYNPQNLYDNSNRAILYANRFLDIVDEIDWKRTNPDIGKLYARRLKGEAYAIRGMFKFFLLRNHGGIGDDGQLLGTPIYDAFLNANDDFAKPRATFTDMVNSAYADFTEALKYLPMDYGNLPNLAALPPGFSDVKDIDHWTRVFGDDMRQRISGRHVKAFRGRVALLAASPAFNLNNTQTLWEQAANYNAELLNDINGPAGLDATGHIFYLAAQINNARLSSGDYKDLPEIVWRRPIYSDRVREEANFPPSLYGNGRINPTQNLVDAFPMANGYPITHASSNYNPANPYAGRDPRLNRCIVFNGSSMKSTTIRTGSDGGVNAVDALPTSTRTGYYMRKLLREEVNLTPGAQNTQEHFQTHIRMTEIFLNYAEAANEAWGPTGTGSNSYSAKDVLAAIRKRAGIAQPDNYLNSITDQATMRQLIRNERRLELCFESHRFWDLRRWKENLSVPARGVRIDGTTYTYFDVEARAYDNDYMHYGPIPYNEVLKFGFVQNKGWN